MSERLRHLAPIVASAVALALLAASLPGAVSAGSPTKCRVLNRTSGSVHRDLQQAVWRAKANDRLRVRGTCTGTVIIRKPLTIRGLRRVTGTVDTGRARVRSGSGRPAIVVDPGVDTLTIHASVSVRSGIVIGPVEAWKRPRAMIRQIPKPPAGKRRLDRTCHDDLRAKVASASTGDRIYFHGCQNGAISIERRLRLTGTRIGASTITCGPGGCTKVVSDSGVPFVRRPGPLPSIEVSSSVNRLILEGFSIGEGFRIR